MYSSSSMSADRTIGAAEMEGMIVGLGGGVGVTLQIGGRPCPRYASVGRATTGALYCSSQPAA